MTRPGSIGTSWEGRRVAVIGMARSGRSVSRLLARHGAAVRATDLRTAPDLGLDPGSLLEEGIELALGQSGLDALEGMEVAVVSPGIPKTAPVLVEAKRRGIPLLSELEAASRFAKAPMAAVTGTNGKSTTVTVLGRLLDALEVPNAVAGNVGLPLSEVVESVPPHGALVVEVSSYQLEDIDTFHPVAAAILNVTPDHLDRYRGFRDYVAVKLEIFRNQGSADTAVLPPDEPLLPAPAGVRVLRFSGEGRVESGAGVFGGFLGWREGGSETPLVPVGELALPGPHNRANAAAALCLLAGLGRDVRDPRIGRALRALRGLPHRLETVGRVGGVAFVNDSKATNPESLEVALRSFDSPVVLVAGGRAKEGDYGRLAPALARCVTAVVLIGEAAPRLREAWSGVGVRLVEEGTDFDRALERALALAGPAAATVLLSPGCASFDMFRDYEDRGERFRAWVAARGGAS